MQPKMPKAKHGEHGQLKVERLTARMTIEGKEGLDRLAQSMGKSVAEVLEMLGRGQLQAQLPPSQSLGELSPN